MWLHYLIMALVPKLKNENLEVNFQTSVDFLRIQIN